MFPYPTSKGTHHMSMKAHEKKKIIWEMAIAGQPKPEDKTLRDALRFYVTPAFEATYDEAFSEALRQKVPSWFRVGRSKRRDNPSVKLFFEVYDRMGASCYKDVAETAGVSLKTVQSWASGDRDFTTNFLVLHKLSTASGISIDKMASTLFESA